MRHRVWWSEITLRRGPEAIRSLAFLLRVNSHSGFQTKALVASYVCMYDGWEL